MVFLILNYLTKKLFTNGISLPLENWFFVLQSLIFFTNKKEEFDAIKLKFEISPEYRKCELQGQ